MVEIDFLAANHVRIVGFVVRIETGLWAIRFDYVACSLLPSNVVEYLDHATTVHGRRAWPAVGTGRWALAVHISQFTV